VYSFNKRGYEAEYWQREIAAASTPDLELVPFNHDPYLDPSLYLRAQLLDNLYYARHPGLMALYRDFRALLDEVRADAIVVDACPPYHPELLRLLDVYKVLRIADGPMAAYDRDFAYLHAYDHILYHSTAYSRDLEMPEKLAYCGAKRHDLWPLWLFDAMHVPAADEATVFAKERDIDVVFVGGLFVNKMPLLAAVKRAFGRRMRLHGLGGWKKNLYFNTRFGLPGWVTPLPADRYVPLYSRAKIGINVHNRGKYTVGGFRLFELPANGVMQISDGDEYLATFFEPGREIVGYESADDLVDRIRYYLEHEQERLAIARAGYARVMAEHRLSHRMTQLAGLLKGAMAA